MRRPIAHLTPFATTAPIQQAADNTSSSVEFEVLMRLLGQRYVLYYPVLSDLTGSVNASLMLGQALYWTKKYLIDHPQRKGWFWHTCQDWTSDTALSRHEQVTARSHLRTTGLMNEKLMGAPARMHFQVNLSELGSQIASQSQTSFDGWSWEDACVRSLLGRPVAFLRAFADVTKGNITAALYLSSLCQAKRMISHNAADTQRAVSRFDIDGDWMDLPFHASAKRLRVSERSLRGARQYLIQAGLIQERSSGGVQPAIYTRLMLDKLHSLVVETTGQRITTPSVERSAKRSFSAKSSKKGVQSPAKISQVTDSKGMAETSIPDLTKPANWNGGNEQSRPCETGKLDLAKPANQFAGFGSSIRGFTTLKGRSTSQPTTLNLEESTRKDERGSSGVLNQKREGQPLKAETQPEAAGHTATSVPVVATQSETQSKKVTTPLELPPNLLAMEAQSAARILDRLPENDRQIVADEWAGQISVPGKIRNKLGYLLWLVKAAEQGEFVPTIALQVAAAREQSRAHQAAMAHARNLQPWEVPTVGSAAEQPVQKTRSQMPDSFREGLKRMGLPVKGMQ